MARRGVVCRAGLKLAGDGSGSRGGLGCRNGEERAGRAWAVGQGREGPGRLEVVSRHAHHLNIEPDDSNPCRVLPAEPVTQRRVNRPAGEPRERAAIR